MQYNFRGVYDSTLSYAVKDVVSYQPTINDDIRYYFCLTANDSTNIQTPNPSGDTQYWAVVNTLSNFPNDVDTFINHTNIQASDQINVQRFQELTLKSNRTTTEDDELNTLTQTLRDKLILPQDFNSLQESISNLQMFFKTNVEGYINDKQIEFQIEIDKFNHKGEYNPTTQYYKRNTVTYNGETFICKEDILGTPPDNLQDTIYWGKIAARGSQGEQGVAGTGLRYQGAYEATKQYYQDDAVQYGGQLFACLQDNIGQTPNPDNDTSYWSLAIAKGESTKVTVLKNIVYVTNQTVNVPINIQEFNPFTDELEVRKNTVVLTEGSNEDYVINANQTSIDKADGTLWDGTTNPIRFEFIVRKNFVVDLTFSDGNMIQDDTVGNEKLKPDNKVGSLSTLTTTNKNSITEALNEVDESVKQNIVDFKKMQTLSLWGGL